MPFVRRWMVPIVLAIAVWEIVSPYVLSFSGGPLVNAVITGVVVVVLALWALRIPSRPYPAGSSSLPGCGSPSRRSSSSSRTLPARRSAA